MQEAFLRSTKNKIVGVDGVRGNILEQQIQ